MDEISFLGNPFMIAHKSGGTGNCITPGGAAIFK
jgi:hypothetical protein